MADEGIVYGPVTLTPGERATLDRNLAAVDGMVNRLLEQYRKVERVHDGEHALMNCSAIVQTASLSREELALLVAAAVRRLARSPE
jgi:hypothetical protein